MFRRYRPYQKGEFIVVGVDTAWTGTDYVTGQFLSKTNRDVPVVYHTNKVSMTIGTQALHTELESIYDQTKVKPVLAIETNNGGTGWIETMNMLNRQGKYTLYRRKSMEGTIHQTEDSDKLGFTTNSATRPRMLGDLKEAIDAKMLVIADKPTINEMFAFIINNRGRPEAEQGSHDDLIMALAIAWQLYQSEAAPIKKVRKHREIKRSKFHV